MEFRDYLQVIRRRFILKEWVPNILQSFQYRIGRFYWSVRLVKGDSQKQKFCKHMLAIPTQVLIHTFFK